MIVEIVDRIGGRPIRVNASQVLIRHEDGTPIGIAGEYGPSGNVRICHGMDRDFDQTLRAFGYRGDRVKVESVDLSGSRPDHKLLAGPGL